MVVGSTPFCTSADHTKLPIDN